MYFFLSWGYDVLDDVIVGVGVVPVLDVFLILVGCQWGRAVVVVVAVTVVVVVVVAYGVSVSITDCARSCW